VKLIDAGHTGKFFIEVWTDGKRWLTAIMRYPMKGTRRCRRKKYRSPDA
jgi:hypothetical protein